MLDGRRAEHFCVLLLLDQQQPLQRDLAFEADLLHVVVS
jgi:hypothetical protein